MLVTNCMFLPDFNTFCYNTKVRTHLFCFRNNSNCLKVYFVLFLEVRAVITSCNQFGNVYAREGQFHWNSNESVYVITIIKRGKIKIVRYPFKFKGTVSDKKNLIIPFQSFLKILSITTCTIFLKIIA